MTNVSHKPPCLSSDDLPMHILLIDDDDVDYMALKRAIERQDLPYTLSRARNGEEGLAILRDESSLAHRAAHDHRAMIILLDINMPRMNGIEFLEHLRNDEALRRLVVFTLTTSHNPRDRDQVYSQNVAGHILKSSLGSDMAELTRLIQQYEDAVSFP